VPPEPGPTRVAPLVLEHLDRYVANADAKIGVLFAADAVVGGVVLAALPNDALPRAFAWLSVVAVVAGLLACLYAVYPRLPPKGTSLFYWEDVAARASRDAYAAEVVALPGAEVDTEIARMSYSSARALHRKFMGIRVALLATLVALVAAGTSLATG
jgi:Pycsar effector protein